MATERAVLRALQGLNKKETAEKFSYEVVYQWRRSYDTLPEPLLGTNIRHPGHDPRYRIPQDDP